MSFVDFGSGVFSGWNLKYEKYFRVYPRLVWSGSSCFDSPRSDKDTFLRFVPCLAPNQMHWLLSVSFLFHEKGKIICPFPPKGLHKCSGHVSPAAAAPRAFPSVQPLTISFCAAPGLKMLVSLHWESFVALKSSRAVLTIWLCLDLHHGNASVYFWRLSLPQMTEEIQRRLMLLLIFRSISNLIYSCQWRATLFCTEFCLEQPWASFLWVSLCRRHCMSPEWH